MPTVAGRHERSTERMPIDQSTYLDTPASAEELRRIWHNHVRPSALARALHEGRRNILLRALISPPFTLRRARRIDDQKIIRTNERLIVMPHVVATATPWQQSFPRAFVVTERS